ncbi:DUF5696 domain-containing protein [Niabella aurantiaca]|uniref:DUF5696 domain-containing protein n=1 Tax=Niabella aurantiaca TaxID=379900 RepID=UPI000380246A|nr:DUF5696 domain-containing protein [Niabella aurantiaca]
MQNKKQNRGILFLIYYCGCMGLALFCSMGAGAQRPMATQKPPVFKNTIFGAPEVTVRKTAGVWTIAGKKNTVSLKSSDLSLGVKTAGSDWHFFPSRDGDLIIKDQGKERTLRLAAAPQKKIVYYNTGYKSGVQINLAGWPGTDLKLFLTLALEGPAEELVFDIAAGERNTVVRKLDWPAALDASTVDYTLLSNVRGVLLPRNWPKPYHPIRTSEPDGTITRTDRSELQSNVIEDWSMSWWGFQKGTSAMMLIVETPNDAAYQFRHPAGGPTVIGPRWRSTLGKLGYPRTVRMCFFEKGNYVDMAKRYRQYAIETGLFVSLKDKVAAKPQVGSLIGTPIVRSGILTDYLPGSARWKRDSATRHAMVTFDQRAEQFRLWKAKGLSSLMVVLTGWPKLGYDRQHPDVLPPAPAAGGWEGMRRLGRELKAMGYLFGLHDQYRDYYVDAPSFNTQFAIHEEDSTALPAIFPGTRFGDYKEGQVPYMDYWDGGKMSYLNSRFMLGHMKKNYQWLFDHEIKPQASYLDVFGYVPPDEDFNPQNRVTRTDALNDRIKLYRWAKAHLGIVGTETACDWTVPYVDFSSPLKARNGITVPLWDLVYHDAILTTYNPADLYGLLNAGLPQLGRDFDAGPAALAQVKRMSALNRRLAFTEMTNHEFLNRELTKERTTFSDGTTITVDWDKKTTTISPEIKESL